LAKIADKRYIDEYLLLLKKPNDAIKLPFTMIMLGKWQVSEAKAYYMEYLESDLMYINTEISDLVYISVEALSYYKDNDENVISALSEKLNSGSKDLNIAVQKALNRIEKRKNGKSR
jgi:hypothetical protein